MCAKTSIIQWIAGLGVLALLSLPACKNVCEKFAERVDECLVEFCEEYPDNPLCAEDAQRGEDADIGECPSEQHGMYELLLERSCEQLAREMGWEALNMLPP